MGISRVTSRLNQAWSSLSFQNGLWSHLLSYKGSFHLHSSFLFCCQLPGIRQAWLCLRQGPPGIWQLPFEYFSPCLVVPRHPLPSSTYPTPNQCQWPGLREHGDQCRVNFPQVTAFPGSALPLWHLPSTPLRSISLHPPTWQREMPALPPTGRQSPSRIKLRSRQGPGAGVWKGKEMFQFGPQNKGGCTPEAREGRLRERYQGPQGWRDLPCPKCLHRNHLCADRLAK